MIVGGNNTTIVIGGLIAKGDTNVGGVDTTLQIWGLYHLVGITVSVCLGALDLGDFVVAADGSVTVSLIPTVGQPNAWSAVQLAAMDAQYGENTMLTQLNSGSGAVFINLPCVIGQAYVSQGQRLRLLNQQDAKTTTGGALGMRRRTHMVGTLLQNAMQISFGTSLTPSPLGNMDNAILTQADETTTLASGTSFSGVYWGTIEDGSTFDSQLCWQIDRPYPATVSAITSFMETNERK